MNIEKRVVYQVGPYQLDSMDKAMKFCYNQMADLIDDLVFSQVCLSANDKLKMMDVIFANRDKLIDILTITMNEDND